MATNIITAPSVQRTPGVYNLPAIRLPTAAQSISIAIDRTNLAAIVGPVAAIGIEGSDDGGATWVGLGGCTLDGGVILKRDGSVLTETFYTVQFTDRDGVIIPFPDSYRVRATVTIVQTCTCGAVVRIL